MPYDIAGGIKLLRTKHQMTQASLAEKLGLTADTLSNYETGKTRPDMLTIIKIADLFKCSTDRVIKFKKGLSVFEEFNEETIRNYRPSNIYDEMIGNPEVLHNELPDTIYTDMIKENKDIIDKFN